jgi:hypothetical protein
MKILGPEKKKVQIGSAGKMWENSVRFYSLSLES